MVAKLKSPKTKYGQKPRGEYWLKMKLDGDYILSWALTAPNALQSAIVEERLDDEGLIQANAIIEVLQDLLPPRPDPKNWHFLVQLGHERSFLDFRIVPKHVKASRIGEYSSRTFSLVPRDWYRDGYERLVKRFHKEFFGHKPSIREMEKFILDPQVSEISYEDALDSSEFRGPSISY
jgi:hypothetical protein